MKKWTQVEIDELEFELMTTYRSTLTEARFNEIMDAMLPRLETFPEAQFTLESHGKKEWRDRRDARQHKPERPVQAA